MRGEISLGRLTRTSFHDNAVFTATQAQTDSLLGHFLENNARFSVFAPLLAGTCASQLARTGFLSLGTNATGWAARALQATAEMGSLGAEVVAYECTSRAFLTLNQSLVPSPQSLVPFSGGPRTTDQGPGTHLWNWHGEGGLLQGFLTSGTIFGSLRGARGFTQGQNIVLQHGVQGTAMVLGENLAGAFHLIPRPEISLAQQFLNAEQTLLALGAGMAALHLSAPGFQAFERSLRISNRSRALNPRPSAAHSESLGSFALPLGPELLYETLGPPSSEGPRRRPSLPQEGEITRVYSLGGAASTHREDTFRPGEEVHLPSREQVRHLSDRFRPALSSKTSTDHTESILRAVLQTPSATAHFHERLLESFAASDRRGTVGQKYIALGLQEVFCARSLKSATGSLDYALLQLVVNQGVGEADPVRRNRILHPLFQAMEEGLSPSRLTTLIEGLGFTHALSLPEGPQYPRGFWEPYRQHATHAWRGYSEEDVVVLRNLVYQMARNDHVRASRLIRVFGEARSSGRYAPEDIDRAMARAREHPLGRLILQRLVHVLAVEDNASKVRELADWGREREGTLSHISRLRGEGMAPDAIAQAMNGTYHTGYLNDIRLARKITSVFSEVEPFFNDPTRREQNRDRFYEAMGRFLRSGRPLTPQAMFDLLETNGDPAARSLREAFEAGRFEITILPGKEFDQIVSRWGQVPNCALTFFLKQEGQPDRVMIRAMENGRTIEEVQLRLTGLIHEGEHWRHFSGNFEGIEEGGNAIPLRSISRHDRLVSEIMAFLEMQRFRNRNTEIDTWEIARRLNMNLPLFYRNYNDISYFGRTNDRLAREWMGS